MDGNIWVIIVKQKMTLLFLISYFLILTQPVFADVFEVFVPGDQKVVIVGDVQKREHALESLKQEKEKLLSHDTVIKNQQDLNKINDLIANYKQKINTVRESEKDYYNTVLGVLSETAQLLLDIQLSRQKNTQTIDSHISVLENYLKDPYFKLSKAEVSAVYSFDDLQKLYQELIAIKEKVKLQKDQLEALKKERSESKNEILLISKELKERERERSGFNELSRGHHALEDGGWGITEEAKLLDFEIKMLTTKKDCAELKIKELGYQLGMMTTRLELLIAQQEAIENDLERIDRSLRVTDLEVIEAQEQLVNKKSAAANEQAQYSQEIRHLSHDKQLLKNQFEKMLDTFKIDLRSPQELDDWSIDSSKFDSEFAIYNLGYLNEKIRVVDSQIEMIEAKKTLEKVRLIFDEVMVKAITSWHKISQRNLRSEEDIEHEKSKYIVNKSEGQRILVSYRDKQELISKNINHLARALSNLQNIINELKKNQHRLIHRYSSDSYHQTIESLEHASELMALRIDLNRNLTDLYTSIIGVEKDIVRHIEMVEERLSKIGIILQRSKHAISWENIYNIGPNLSMFVFGLKSIISSYVNDFSFNNILQWFKNLLEQPLVIYYTLGIFIFWFLIFLLLRLALPVIKDSLLSLRPRANNLGVLWGVGLLLVELLNSCLLSNMIWSTVFIMLLFGWITNIGLQILFYLISIPYLCYISYLLVHNLVQINLANNYVIINQAMQKRFTQVLSFFIYSSIIILFFREAFLLVAYESDLPKVLSAFYSVIVRAAIIFLIGKDELVSVIPKHGAVWDLARNYVTFYYYPLLVAIISIMVVSDPYILGFNKLVSFIFWGIVSTLFILLLARWLQDQVRKIAAYAFFYSTDSGARERFDNAKTWYGLLIILIYFSVFAICVLLLAKIWGYSLYLSDFQKWFNYELFVIREGSGLISITPKSFVTLFVYLMSGMLLAWAFERFVLQRIFSILLIDRGAQNTVSIISKYFIGLVVTLIGLYSIKLGGLIVYVIGALAFGVVWAIKDPVNDFISYFIILLDRTVKIGDYIEVDDRIVGVVRKISPRSVLLRRKNSVSIVVPNSKLTSMPVYNWGYTRGFFAFKDIEITVPYTADASKVREILANVLNENLNILKSPAPVIRLNEFGESGYIFMVRGFMSSINVLNQWDIASDIRLEIVSQLRKAKIVVAPPMRLMVNSSELRKMYNLEEQLLQNQPDLSSAGDSNTGTKE
jgi:small-conductance mechanosensitive channel/predicted HicB family RNase H-like nuclease